MKSPLLILLLATALAATTGGCRADESSRENAMGDSTRYAFSFEGDFNGPLGLQLYSVRDAAAADLPGTLAQVRAMGFREVELAGTYGLEPVEFMELLEDVGLRPTAMHAGYEDFRNNVDEVLDDAEVLGVDFVGTAWIPHPADQPFDAEMARAAAAEFNSWGRAAAERGLTFFYHIHGYEFREDGSGRTPFDVLATATDSVTVKFEMDVFWTTLPGADPVELLQTYPGRWKLMHLKDMKQDWPLDDHTGQAPPEADVPVGTGQIDYAAVLEAAREAGVAKYYIEDESEHPMRGIRSSIEFLEQVSF